MKHNKKQITDRYLGQYERGIFLFQSACFILVGVGWLIGFLMTEPPRVWSPVNNLWAALVMLGGGAQILHERSRRRKIRDYIQELQEQRAADKD